MSHAAQNVRLGPARHGGAELISYSCAGEAMMAFAETPPNITI